MGDPEHDDDKSPEVGWLDILPDLIVRRFWSIALDVAVKGALLGAAIPGLIGGWPRLIAALSAQPSPNVPEAPVAQFTAADNARWLALTAACALVGGVVYAAHRIKRAEVQKLAREEQLLAELAETRIVFGTYEVSDGRRVIAEWGGLLMEPHSAEEWGLTITEDVAAHYFRRGLKILEKTGSSTATPEEVAELGRHLDGEEKKLALAQIAKLVAAMDLRSLLKPAVANKLYTSYTLSEPLGRAVVVAAAKLKLPRHVNAINTGGPFGFGWRNLRSRW